MNCNHNPWGRRSLSAQMDRSESILQAGKHKRRPEKVTYNKETANERDRTERRTEKTETGSEGERTGASASDATGDGAEARSGRTGMEMSKRLTAEKEVARETTGKNPEQCRM